MRECSWKVVRGHDMGEDGYMRIERCERCGAGRYGLLKPGGDAPTVITTHPDPLPDECSGDPHEWQVVNSPLATDDPLPDECSGDPHRKRSKALKRPKGT